MFYEGKRIMYNEMKEFQLKYWNEYLFYEKEFIGIIDYIHLDINNFNTYSFKLLEMLIGICSAIDRMLRKYTGLTGQNCNIKDYKDSIINIENDFYNLEARLINNDDIILKPFSEWESSEKAPTFWNAYNDIKHNKNGGIINATYKNVITALSALYLMNIKYMNKIYNYNNAIEQNYPENESELFYIKGYEKRIRNDLLHNRITVREDKNETILIEKN